MVGFFGQFGVFSDLTAGVVGMAVGLTVFLVARALVRASKRVFEWGWR